MLEVQKHSQDADLTFSHVSINSLTPHYESLAARHSK